MRYLSVCSGIEAATVAAPPCWPPITQPFPTSGTSPPSRRTMSAQLTFLLAAPLAKPSPSLESERAWTIRAATSRLSFWRWLADLDLAGWSGRTSLVSCRSTADGRLAPSSGRWGNSGMGSPIGFSTLNTSESPSAVVASSLSDVLEATGSVPPRYYLSARACAGILRRAAKRGKTLPPLLAEALETTPRAREV